MKSKMGNPSQFFQRPHLVSDPRFHCWRQAYSGSAIRQVSVLSPDFCNASRS